MSTSQGRCNKCGTPNPSTAVICRDCNLRLPWAAAPVAQPTKKAAAFVAASASSPNPLLPQTQRISAAPPVPAPYPQPGSAARLKALEVPEDHFIFGYALIGFLIPLIGLLIYITYRTDSPGKANSAGKGAICNMIFGGIAYALFAIFSGSS